MSTTTVRLPEDLKERLAGVAERRGISSHALILKAVAERVEAAERRNNFHDTAEERYTEIVASGATISWTEMRAYLKERVAGRESARPAARKFTR